MQRDAAVGAMLTRQEIVVTDCRVCHQPFEKTLLVMGVGFCGTAQPQVGAIRAMTWATGCLFLLWRVPLFVLGHRVRPYQCRLSVVWPVCDGSAFM